jgi:hypothetical protein
LKATNFDSTHGNNIFNHINKLSIARIVPLLRLQLEPQHFALKFESNVEMGQKGVFFKSLAMGVYGILITVQETNI